jgi:hypothetical protein
MLNTCGVPLGTAARDMPVAPTDRWLQGKAWHGGQRAHLRAWFSALTAASCWRRLAI